MKEPKPFQALYYLFEGLVRAVGAMGHGDEIVPELEQQILKPLRT